MTAAAAILLTTAGCMFLAPAVVAAIAWFADRAADREEAKRREIQGREVSAEWLAILAATEPSLSAHPSAGRIRDLIAANEAARIDDEWKAMNA